MFKNILGKNKSQTDEDAIHQAIVEKVSKMGLTDMRIYVNNKMEGFGICEDGLSEVMRVLNSEGFIQEDAMDSKKKKAFDLVEKIALNKKATIVTVELIQEFYEKYRSILSEYDTKNKQIYADKIKTALNTAIENIETMAEMNRKMKIIGS